MPHITNLYVIKVPCTYFNHIICQYIKPIIITHTQLNFFFKYKNVTKTATVMCEIQQKPQTWLDPVKPLQHSVHSNPSHPVSHEAPKTC